MAGSLYLIFIGLMVMAMGLVFVGLMGRSFFEAKKTRDWPQVEARIVESREIERKVGSVVPEFSHQIQYRYSYEGKEHEWHLLRERENPWYKKRDKIEASLEKFPKGEKVTAFVNPMEPAKAVLEHETKAGGYSIWFPALFVVGGGGIVLRALWLLFRKKPASSRGS